jgi:pyruvate formate lyase activating enzyme
MKREQKLLEQISTSSLEVNENAMELKGNIFEIQKMSTEDGPGIRTTVFFLGCPLRCVWCHNPESQQKKPSIQWFKTRCINCKICMAVCPNQALSLENDGMHINRDLCQACGTCAKACPGTAMQKLGDWWTVDALFDEVAKDKAYYIKSNGGVTASGGEAAEQGQFLQAFFEKCKQNQINTALELCGFLPQEIYEPLLPFVDLYLYDIKEIDSAKHKQFTGVPNERILENIIWLVHTATLVNPNAQIWIQTPLIPEYSATEENIQGIGNFIVNQLENCIDRWNLLSFNNLAKDKYRRMDQEWVCAGLPLFTKNKMEQFVQIALSTGVKNVHWSGLTRNENDDGTVLIDDQEIGSNNNLCC